MNSPAHDDDDDAARQTTPAPPWAEAARERDEKRRLHEQITAAAEQLKQEAHELPFAEPVPPGQWGADDIFEMAKLREGGFELEETRRGIWAPALGPVFMPLPPQEKASGWFGLGAVVAVGSAVGIAAGLAFVVMNALQLPSISGSTASSDALTKVQSRAPVSTAVLGSLAQVSSAEAKVAPSEVVSPPTSAVLSAVQANADLAAQPPAPVAPTATAAINVASASPAETVAPAAASAPPPPPPPARPAVSLARDEVETLMRRGRYLLAAGDIASARLILTHLADSGEADAAFLLAGTYDAAELAKAHFVGAVPDAAKARAWYARAAEQGSQEASRRLQQSALR